MITIREVTTKQDLKKFIRLPWKIYKGVEQWVPPLLIEEKEIFNPEKHPFYKHAVVKLFLAERDGTICGRIAGIVNFIHNEFHQDKVGFFGFFECINDRAIARMLFDRVAAFLRFRNLDTMRGPMNFSTNETCGLLVDAFHLPPCVMMPYNPPYYAALIEDYGFTKSKDLLAYQLLRENFNLRVIDIAERLKQKMNLTVRNINLREIDREMQIIKSVYNSAWEKNWGFVPMTDDEFVYLAAKMKQIADARLCVIIEHEGKPISFMLNLPDINILLKKINGRLFPFGIFILLFGIKRLPRFRTLTLGVIKEYRGKGMESILYTYNYSISKEIGVTEAELSWVLEDNTIMVNGLERLNCVRSKTYRIYDYPLTRKDESAV